MSKNRCGGPMLLALAMRSPAASEPHSNQGAACLPVRQRPLARASPIPAGQALGLGDRSLARPPSAARTTGQCPISGRGNLPCVVVRPKRLLPSGRPIWSLESGIWDAASASLPPPCLKHTVQGRATLAGAYGAGRRRKRWCGGALQRGAATQDFPKNRSTVALLSLYSAAGGRRGWKSLARNTSDG